MCIPGNCWQCSRNYGYFGRNNLKIGVTPKKWKQKIEGEKSLLFRNLNPKGRFIWPLNYLAAQNFKKYVSLIQPYYNFPLWHETESTHYRSNLTLLGYHISVASNLILWRGIYSKSEVFQVIPRSWICTRTASTYDSQYKIITHWEKSYH